MKRPCAREGPSHYCQGRGAEEQCVFSTVDVGKKSLVSGSHCVFCCEDRMVTALSTSRGKGQVTRSLRAFQEAGREDIYNKAIDKLPNDEWRAYFQKALRRTTRRKGAAEDRKLNRLPDEWKKAQEHRVSIQPEATEETQRCYQRLVADDRRRVERKFPALHDAKQTSTESWRSEAAKKFADWCRVGAWVQCQTCKRLEKRPLNPLDMEGARRTCIKKACKHCKSQIGYPTMRLSDIPEILRELPQDVLWALRPFGTFLWRSCVGQAWLSRPH